MCSSNTYNGRYGCYNRTEVPFFPGASTDCGYLEKATDSKCNNCKWQQSITTKEKTEESKDDSTIG